MAEMHARRISNKSDGRAGTRPRSAEAPVDRRQEIIQIAARLFAEHGFEGTSVRQIASEVNILPGSLYHHFATKDDILHAVIREQTQMMASEADRLLKLPVDAEHRLVTHVIGNFANFYRNWEVHAILMNDSHFFRRNPDFAYVDEAKETAYGMLSATMEDGIGAGLFRADMNVPLTIATIARMLSSAATWYRGGDSPAPQKPSQYTMDEMVIFHVDCVLRMVRAPARIEDPIPMESCQAIIGFPRMPAHGSPFNVGVD